VQEPGEVDRIKKELIVNNTERKFYNILSLKLIYKYMWCDCQSSLCCYFVADISDEEIIKTAAHISLSAVLMHFIMTT